MACYAQNDVSARVLRYMLQAAARDLLLRDWQGRTTVERRQGNYAERTAYCLRVVVAGAGGVDVLHYPETGGAGYRNLITCASVWACPVCSAKITERRRVEIAGGLAGSGLLPVLATFTLQHNQADKLPGLLAALLDGYRRFFKGDGWQSLRCDYAIVGRIRSLENTHGERGWHPHVHALLLLPDLPGPGFDERCRDRWAAAVERAGHYASKYHGLLLQVGDQAAGDYLAKLGLQPVEVPGWSLSHELVKGPVKGSRKGGRSMHQLLADYMLGDERAGRLWLDYYWAFKGQKHLVWSRGLRDRLGLEDEQTDVEVEAREDEVAVVLATLSRSQWQVILKAGVRGELLDVAASGDVVALCAFLASVGVEGVTNDV